MPSRTPFRILSRRPPPGVGPFRIARSTRRGITLVKDPGFALPGLPQAGVDRIAVRFTGRSASVDAQSDVPRDGPGVVERDGLSTYWFALNARRRPFDRRDVREAVRLALDVPALARRFGMRPACSLLPPGVPGHEVPDPCPYGTPQLDRARELVAAAGARGARVNVYTNTERLPRRSAQVLVAAMRDIGLRPRLRVVRGSIFFSTVGNQRTPMHATITSWHADFVHPQNFLWLVDGATIQRRFNQNWSNTDDSELNRLIEEVAAVPPAEAAGAAAAADRRIRDEVHLIPWAHSIYRARFSDRVPGECRVLHPIFGVDVARLCVR